MSWRNYLVLIFLLEGIRLSKTLKKMTMNVPRAVRVGHSVTLECDYDLEGAALYSVRWYRDNNEFYRYVPKEAPPTRVFPLPGLHVDVSVSDDHKVTLLSIGQPMAGMFQCEVSADAPSFHTEMMAAPMTIAVVPDGVPVITVDKSSLEQGGPLISECSAPASFPALNLTWYVNDQKVPGSTSYWTKKEAELEKSFSRLELTGVGGSWGAIRLRCEANLFRLFRANSLEVSVKPDVPQPASVLLMGSSRKNGDLRIFHTSMPFLIMATVLIR
ncbi:uncharacterized protein LOC123308630 isoform X2 [Coccinella septempunctata]|uniref:uncharacterized protein LOC123308630 isoform X2 n=1 Tax=Coccinella septempunctata TaxID=41139 RepID=UPI001D075100|nr:uncharacterized protein LOC123308630 isoform X2 [Coccinella septempunctata]